MFCGAPIERTAARSPGRCARCPNRYGRNGGRGLDTDVRGPSGSAREGRIMRRTRWVEGVGALVVASTVAVTVGSVLPAQASLLHSAVVSENPSDTTPHIPLSTTSLELRVLSQR